MGSYGIGPARIAAAAVEQYADEHGISLAEVDRAVRRAAGRPRASRARRARAGRSPLRGAAASGLRRPLRRSRPAAPARSSSRPSCSAARCGWSSASAPPTAASWRCRCAAGRRSDPSRSRARRGALRDLLAGDSLSAGARARTRQAEAVGARPDRGARRPRRSRARRCARSRCPTSSATSGSCLIGRVPRGCRSIPATVARRPPSGSSASARPATTSTASSLA